MHILTKVFVIIAALLSVLLSSLAVSYAINTDRIRADYDDARTAATVAEAAAANAAAQNRSEIERVKESNRLAQEQVNRLTDQVNTLAGERSQLTAAKERAEQERALTESKIGELSELAQTQATLLQNYRDEVTTLRRNELTFRQRALEMENRLSDLESQRQVLEQNYRALQEELAGIRRDASGGTVAMGATGGSGFAGGGSAEPFVYAGPVIRGSVESVQTDPTAGRTLVKLNIGANDRVSRNMLLRVVRGNEFIANVVVTEADMSFAVGTVDTLGRDVTVQPGDSVISRIQ